MNDARYGEPSDAYKAHVLASIAEKMVKPVADLPTRLLSPPRGQYVFRDGATEVSVQTHAEFVAFVNWWYGEKGVPLPVADEPRIF